MDPHRSSYPEEQEPRWHPGDQYQEREWDGSYDGFRVPDPRGEGVRYAPAGGPIGRRSGEPLPPLPADVPPRVPVPPVGGPAPEPPGRFHTEAIDRGALRRPQTGAPPGPDGIYRARRPATALALGAVTSVLALPLVRLLLVSLGSPVSPGGLVASLLMLLALPLGAMGMYGLMTGAARVPDAAPRQVWLRPPLAYLTVALVLFVAAGLAAS